MFCHNIYNYNEFLKIQCGFVFMFTSKQGLNFTTVTNKIKRSPYTFTKKVSFKIKKKINRSRILNIFIAANVFFPTTSITTLFQLFCFTTMIVRQIKLNDNNLSLKCFNLNICPVNYKTKQPTIRMTVYEIQQQQNLKWSEEL